MGLPPVWLADWAPTEKEAVESVSTSGGPVGGPGTSSVVVASKESLHSLSPYAFVARTRKVCAVPGSSSARR